MARALRRDHQHVEIGPRLDQVEMDVEPVREHQRRAVLHVGGEMIAVDIGLQLVGREHHHHVGPFGRIRDFLDRQLDALRLLGRSRALAQRHGDFLHAGIVQIERVGVALAAVADDGDLLALDQVQVGVAVVVNTHVFGSLVSDGYLADRRYRQSAIATDSIPSSAASLARTSLRTASGTSPMCPKTPLCTIQGADLVDENRSRCRESCRKRNFCGPRSRIRRDRADDREAPAPMEVKIAEYDHGSCVALLAPARRPQVRPDEIPRLGQ